MLRSAGRSEVITLKSEQQKLCLFSPFILRYIGDLWISIWRSPSLSMASSLVMEKCQCISTPLLRRVGSEMPSLLVAGTFFISEILLQKFYYFWAGEGLLRKAITLAYVDGITLYKCQGISNTSSGEYNARG